MCVERSETYNQRSEVRAVLMVKGRLRETGLMALATAPLGP